MVLEAFEGPWERAANGHHCRVCGSQNSFAAKVKRAMTSALLKTSPSMASSLYKHLAAGLAAGLVLRLFFILRFPFSAGDTKFYEQLARNWLDHHVYGLFIAGQLNPVDMRMPGYPAFLAAVYALAGRTRTAIMLAQAVVDLGACALTALLAARLAPPPDRSRVAIAAIWLAALCPFTANYTAVPLTEVLAAFLTALALLVFLHPKAYPIQVPLSDKQILLSAGTWCFAGITVGLGTLVRPETPLLLIALGITLATRWRRPRDWSKLTLAASWLAVGLLIPLLPWAVRNAHTLGRVQFLAPRYAESYGDFIPRGFFSWTQTWMVRFRHAYLVTWKVSREPIKIETLPDSAFDSPKERARVARLLSEYNKELKMTPLLDSEFGRLASERTGRHPLRTYVFVPISRAYAMWFTPRIALLPYSGDLWPLAKKWHNNPIDFAVTVGFGLLNIVYVGLALVGAWRSRSHPGLVLLAIFVLLRTAFMTQLQTVEPRYVIICFPVVLALGAQACILPQRQTSLARVHTPTSKSAFLRPTTLPGAPEKPSSQKSTTP